MEAALTNSPATKPDQTIEDERWLTYLSAMQHAEKTLPDDFFCVPAVQCLAEFLAETEDRISHDQRALLLGIGALLVRQGRDEMRAWVQTQIALGRLKPVARP